MLTVGLIGIGFMGRGHLDNYIRLEAEGFPVKLAALCDVDEKKFRGEFVPGNLDVGNSQYDFGKYRLYSDYKEMLAREKLDYVDIALPTYLHCPAAVDCLDRGVHVLCEKPMALNPDECQRMIDAAKRGGKKLMIGQCLRFWPQYEYLKEAVDSGRFGKATCAYFFRGGDTPRWSFENWLLVKEKSGGCPLDQHIHDVDMINFLFGLPPKVTASARTLIPGSGYDCVSVNYLYGDKVVNAQDDWTLSPGFGFEMIFRVNFEKASLCFLRDGSLKVYLKDGSELVPELSADNGYYREIKYFAEAVANDTPIVTCAPESARDTIRVAAAEMKSAGNGGEVTAV